VTEAKKGGPFTKCFITCVLTDLSDTIPYLCVHNDTPKNSKKILSKFAIAKNVTFGLISLSILVSHIPHRSK
jgi:hypothetical protein